MYFECLSSLPSLFSDSPLPCPPNSGSKTKTNLEHAICAAHVPFDVWLSTSHLPGATPLTKTDFTPPPHPRYMPIASQLGPGLHSHLPSPWWGFVWVELMLGLEGLALLLWATWTIPCCSPLSTLFYLWLLQFCPPSTLIPQPWGRGMWRPPV